MKLTRLSVVSGLYITLTVVLQGCGPSAPKAPPQKPFKIKNKNTGLCVNVRDGVAATNRIEQNKCDGSLAQSWKWFSGSISDPDAIGHCATDGCSIQISKPTSEGMTGVQPYIAYDWSDNLLQLSAPGILFKQVGDALQGHTIWHTNDIRCLAAVSNSTASGEQLETAPCDDKSPTQQWEIIKDTTVGGWLWNPLVHLGGDGVPTSEDLEHYGNATYAWMFRDAGKINPFRKFARFNPFRWSRKFSADEAIAEVAGTLETRDRPIRLRENRDGKVVLEKEFASAADAVRFLKTRS